MFSLLQLPRSDRFLDELYCDALYAASVRTQERLMSPSGGFTPDMPQASNRIILSGVKYRRCSVGHNARALTLDVSLYVHGFMKTLR